MKESAVSSHSHSHSSSYLFYICCGGVLVVFVVMSCYHQFSIFFGFNFKYSLMFIDYSVPTDVTAAAAAAAEAASDASVAAATTGAAIAVVVLIIVTSKQT